jgi:hypothetical protein
LALLFAPAEATCPAAGAVSNRALQSSLISFRYRASSTQKSAMIDFAAQKFADIAARSHGTVRLAGDERPSSFRTMRNYDWT